MTSAFGAMPPEVTSGVIYAGPGGASLQAAATAWANLSTDLQQSAVSYRNVLNGLTDVWSGPSATAMISALVPYILWVDTTAVQAAHLGTLAQSAAEAANTVRAEVVPPPLIAANRLQLLTLIATNILGQNAPAIAANEAAYSAMWAQDATAMTTYAASSQAATSAITPFTPAPQVATPLAATAVPAQGLGDIITTLLTDFENLPVVQALSTAFGLSPGAFIETTFQSLVSSGLPINVVQLFSSFFGPFLGSGIIAGNIAAQNDIIAHKPSAPMANYPPATPSLTEPKPEVKASAGSGGRIGPMRVPPSWAQPPSVASPATPLPPAGGKDHDHAIGLPVIPAVPVTGGKATKRKGYSDPDDMHYGRPSPSVLRPHPSGG